MRACVSYLLQQLQTNCVAFSDIVNLQLEQCNEKNLEQLFGLLYQKGLSCYVRYLFLTSSNLASLPVNINTLSNLNVLGLSYNAFTQFPSVLLQLPELKTIWLDNNHITSIPQKIKAMPKLTYLNIDNNPLESMPALEDMACDVAVNSPS